MNVQCGVRPGVVDRMVDCICSGSSNNIDALLLSFHIHTRQALIEMYLSTIT
jgi:hypothetical protein